MKKSLAEILEATKGSIIISCQALPSEPMYCEEMSIMPFFANAAKQAGSKCIRTSSIRDVVEIKKATGLPVIGLVKRVVEGYASYITPTMQEVDELVAAESDIIALDCTMRERGDGTTINEFIAQIKEKYPDIVLMADISTFEEGVNAEKCGVDTAIRALSAPAVISPLCSLRSPSPAKWTKRRCPISRTWRSPWWLTPFRPPVLRPTWTAPGPLSTARTDSYHK